MQTLIELSFRNLEQSESLANEISKQVKLCEESVDKITGCRVVVEADDSGLRNGKRYRVQIQLKSPCRDWLIEHASDDMDIAETPVTVVHDAFELARKQLNCTAREIVSELGTAPGLNHGRITKLVLPEGLDDLDRGYGLISTCDGRELRFRADNLVDCQFSRLELGSEVSFMEEPDGDHPRATSVQLAGHYASLID